MAAIKVGDRVRIDTGEVGEVTSTTGFLWGGPYAGNHGIVVKLPDNHLAGYDKLLATRTVEPGRVVKI